MRVVYFLLFSCLACVAQAADRKDACTHELIAEVALVVSPGGAVYIPATINGTEVYFDLVIGSGLAMLAGSTVEALGLQPRVITGYGQFGSGENRLTHYAQLDDLRIGKYKLLSRAAPIVPEPDRQSPRVIEGKPYAGRLGSTFLRRVDVEVFLAERKLRLFRQFECRAKSPAYWGGDVATIPIRYDETGAIVFNLELNGKPVESSLLSGAGTSRIDVNVTSKYFGFDRNSPGTTTRASAGTGAAETFHPMSLTGKEFHIIDAPIALREGSNCKLTGSRAVYGGIGYSSCVNAVPFNLGSDLLSQMRIYISSVRATLYVSRVAGEAAPASGSVAIAPPP